MLVFSLLAAFVLVVVVVVLLCVVVVVLEVLIDFVVLSGGWGVVKESGRDAT
jgi:hypothetical protein